MKTLRNSWWAQPTLQSWTVWDVQILLRRDRGPYRALARSQVGPMSDEPVNRQDEGASSVVDAKRILMVGACAAAAVGLQAEGPIPASQRWVAARRAATPPVSGRRE